MKPCDMTASSPRKRKAPTERKDSNPKSMITDTEASSVSATLFVSSGIQCSLPVRSALVFAHFTQCSDESFYTGLPNSEAIRMLYDFLEPKARRMHHWKGLKSTRQDMSVPRDLKNENLRALTLEQELLVTMLRLKVGLLVHDLAFRFNVSETVISNIFLTWM